jgi:hypothetical protein
MNIMVSDHHVWRSIALMTDFSKKQVALPSSLPPPFILLLLLSSLALPPT